MSLLHCAVGLGFLVLSGAHADDSKRPFGVRDAIEAVRPIDPSINGTMDQQRPKVAPDGRRFFVVTQQGFLETNENEYRLKVFEVAGNRAPNVRLSEPAVLRSAGNWSGIFDATWVGNERIAFRGAEGRDTPQLYFAGVDGSLRKRTFAPSGVQSFASNRAGDLIYLTLPTSDPVAIQAAIGEGYVVGSHLTAMDLYGEQWKDRVVPQRAEVLHLPAGSQSPIPLVDVHVTPEHSRLVRLWISPEGEQAIALLSTHDYVEQWRGYEFPGIKEYVTRASRTLKQRGGKTAPGLVIPGVWNYPQYFLIDLVSREMHPLVIAPAFVWQYSGAQPNAVWSPDGQSVLLVNSMVPLTLLNKLTPADRVLARQHPAVLEVDLNSQEVRPVMFLDRQSLELSALVWAAGGSTVEVATTDEVTKETHQMSFRRRGSTWQLHHATEVKIEEMQPGVSLLIDGTVEATVEQGINMAPQIVIRERGSRESFFVYALNPQLEDLELSPMETIAWTDETDSTWTGGLLYPADYRPGRRYPLVIQTHGYNPDEFLFDSMMFGGDRPASFTGMSARALSARGFFVLQEYQTNDHAWERYYTPEEGPQFIRSYRAAIHALAARNLVDSERVGIIGFSRTCYHVKYLLAHGDYKVAAAAIADGWDFGYFQMLLSDSVLSAKGVYGTIPVGAGLLAWLRDAPTFNADKIHTPLRIEAINPTWVPTEYEMYATLKLVGTPTELTVYPDGVHRLMKPQERYRSQQTNVDWLAFWINGEEDTDPAKAEQYTRWRALRELQCKNADSPPDYCDMVEGGGDRLERVRSASK